LLRALARSATARLHRWRMLAQLVLDLVRDDSRRDVELVSKF
jgi:hypothetical protein